ncbi:MAG: hypothetical protein ACTHMY_14605 [Solirubrobacteraceae bacterium]
MSDELLDRLRRVNPVPGRMPALPIEPVLARLDSETHRSLSASRGARRAIRALPAVASVAVVAVVVAVVLTVGGDKRSTATAISPPRPTHPTPPPPRPAGRQVNVTQLARGNVRDTPLELFQRNPGVIDPSGAAEPRETVIPSTVRQLGTFTVAGVGRIQYWVADTRQHGICGALRLPGGDWAGFSNGGRDGGQFPACYATRRQTGLGALIIDGFDYLQTTVPSHNGQRWYILYGAVSTRGTAVRVRDGFSKREASLVRDRYFAIALHPVGNDYGDDVRLEAFNAAGQRIATQGHPLPGTPH